VDELEHGLDEIRVEAELFRFGDVVFEKGFPPVDLKDRDVVLLLEQADLLDPLHPFGQVLNDFAVHLADFRAQVGHLPLEVPVGDLGVPGPQPFQQVEQVLRSHLLFGVAQGLVRVDVGFDHQALDAEIEGHL